MKEWVYLYLFITLMILAVFGLLHLLTVVLPARGLNYDWFA